MIKKIILSGAVLYVELNPVRGGLVVKPQEWPWSSYNFYASGKSNPLIKDLTDIDPYYLKTGRSDEERQKRYQEYIDNVIKEDFLRNIRKQLDEGIFGNNEFIQTMQQRFKIRSPRKRGRPRKNGARKMGSVLFFDKTKNRADPRPHFST